MARNPTLAPATIGSFVDGRFVTSGRLFADIDPVDGSLVAQVAEADRGVVDEAVAAARRAVRGEWGGLSGPARAVWLRRIADAMQARFEDFVAAEIADTGKPAAVARALDVPRGIANFRIFADLIAGFGGDAYEMETPDGQGALSYTINRPLGVVGVISPWNLPLLLLTWKVAPALACGNAVVAKPSEETPGSAALLAEMCRAIGLPAGAFNVVQGFGPESAGEFLTTHPDVDAITFTGESATGSAIMRAVADGVKPISFELGGKNAAVVFADSDIEAAIDGIARAAFSNTGQVCLCTERVYVERKVFDRFVAGLKARAEALCLGAPFDAATTTGPLISRRHREKVVSYYDLAVAEGAEVVTGGGVPIFGDRRDGGAFIQPTILVGLPDTARCQREEIFGPICHVSPFDEEDEVIVRANDSRYGLAAVVWTQNLARAHRVARRLEAGIVWVNTWFLRDLRTPFGGMKLSGIGREGGRHSMSFYSEPTTICVKL